jgi:hypothetical protein
MRCPLPVLAFLVLILSPARGVCAGIPLDVHGFWEARGGVRLQDDKHERDVSLAETRLQVDLARDLDLGTVRLRADFLYDDQAGSHDINLEEGKGWLDVREANVLLYPLEDLDLKVGRQILTWGTGDLVFLNDLFPKDWVSFLLGRDDEYLKAPSDAVKASFFSPMANLDVVYTPRFDVDRFISGERLSYWSNTMGEIVGRNAVVRTETPDEWFTDDEFAVRLFKNIEGYESALYAYLGYWKSPAGEAPQSQKALFPALSVYGASLRGNFWKGIGNAEAAYYDSRDDRGGDDPFVRNSEMRFLIGYEQELVTDLTIGLQYYLEYMSDHGAYVRTLLLGVPPKDEDRHVVTIRLTRLLMNQDLKLSLFAFISPSDEDAYLRPKVYYRFNDNWSSEIGANVFLRSEDPTFFGQFWKNSNMYFAVRYGF